MFILAVNIQNLLIFDYVCFISSLIVNNALNNLIIKTNQKHIFFLFFSQLNVLLELSKNAICMYFCACDMHFCTLWPRNWRSFSRRSVDSDILFLLCLLHLCLWSRVCSTSFEYTLVKFMNDREFVCLDLLDLVQEIALPFLPQFNFCLKLFSCSNTE